MAGIEFRAIAEALTAEQFARRNLPMRGNRAKCPFHGGDNYNLQFFRDGKCYCHVCHKAGDVVTLAAATWHTSQQDAARQLNDVYHLGVTAETMTAGERDQRERARREARELQQQAKQAEAQEWSAACAEERAAREAMARFTEADADKAEFDQALTRLCAAQMRCEILQATAGR